MHFVLLSMASKTSLLDLPNELFPYIFEYLHSTDIVKAFSDIQIHRLEVLIQPFIKRLDISKESDEWNEKFLPDLFQKYEINNIRLKMKHAELLTKDLIPKNIKSVDVVNWDFNYDFSEEITDQLRRNVKKLLLKFPELGEDSDLINRFFRSDTQLESLTIKDCTVYIYNEIEICTQLKYLSVKVEGMEFVFTLLEHLPNLEELKVKMLSQECIGQSPPNINGVQPCKKLHSVTFTGWIKCFDHLETFFTVFGSTIENLSLNIHLMFRTVDGKQLEDGFLDKMPRLSSLNLYIFAAATDTDPIEIETFQTFSWQQFNPIVYWYDIHAQQHVLFTLPWRSDQFEYFSNDFISTCVSNRAVSLNFKRVRTLSLISSTPLNPETFSFIQEVFPNLRRVELTDWIVHSLAEDEDEDEERDKNIQFMSEELRLDTNVQVLSLTEFCVNLCSQRIDYKTFRRFLCFFPNLVSLELDEQPSGCLRKLLNQKEKDDLLRDLLNRINQVKINTWNTEDKLNNAEIHYLFPNAKNIDKSADNDLE